MRFVREPTGEFAMGTDDVEAARRYMPDPGADAVQDEIPARRVEISRPFYLGEIAVTAASRYLAVCFVEELTQLDPDHRYHLATEAE